MKVLYVAPENVTGALDLYLKGHRQRGDEARYVLFFRTPYGFGVDLCFDLWGMPNRWWVNRFKMLFQRSLLPFASNEAFSSSEVRFWRASSRVEELVIKLRDAINGPRIERLIREYDLESYDIYHFEGGIDPYRDGRWVRRLASRGKRIVCFYHGNDLRQRGLIHSVHQYSQLNLTSEIDLLTALPNMKYLYLPIDVEAISPVEHPVEVDPIRIGHAARNRFKGTEAIIKTVKRLESRYPVELILMVNIPHPQLMELKRSCHIFIDQITDQAGWGYGASSVESLAMGIPTVTRINPQVARFLGDHPFLDATEETLERVLTELIENPKMRQEFGQKGREWVRKRHSLEAVMNQLYGYYQELGWV